MSIARMWLLLMLLAAALVAGGIGMLWAIDGAWKDGYREGWNDRTDSLRDLERVTEWPAYRAWPSAGKRESGH